MNFTALYPLDYDGVMRSLESFSSMYLTEWQLWCFTLAYRPLAYNWLVSAGDLPSLPSSISSPTVLPYFARSTVLCPFYRTLSAASV